MDKGSRYQCQLCGGLTWAHEPLNIEEDIFVEMHCKHCHEETNHLWVGDNETDLYAMYNVNVDSRYYKYNTK